MFTLTRLQFLHCVYFVLLFVSCEEFWRDFFYTHNFMQTWVNSFSNPINLLLLPFAAIIGGWEMFTHKHSSELFAVSKD